MQAHFIIHRYKQIDSTQDELRRLAVEGAVEGTVVAAEEQTAGRGRNGREWISPYGGLWFSVLLRPQMPPAKFSPFSLVLSLALVESIKEACGIQLGIKWPNDLVIEERSQESGVRSKNKRPDNIKKVGGVLIESSGKNGVLDWVIAGIGTNVNNEPPATQPFPATSLKELTGIEQDRKTLLEKLLNNVFCRYDEFKKSGFAPMRDEYMSLLVLKGQEIRVTAGAKEICGNLCEVDLEGNLIVKLPSRKSEKVSCGEIII